MPERIDRDVEEQLWKDPNWGCPHCRFTNFAIRSKCRNCGYDSNAGEFPYYNPLPPYDGFNRREAVMDLPSRASDAGPEQGEPLDITAILWSAEDSCTATRKLIRAGSIAAARFQIDYAIEALERAKELLK